MRLFGGAGAFGLDQGSFGGRGPLFGLGSGGAGLFQALLGRLQIGLGCTGGLGGLVGLGLVLGKRGATIRQQTVGRLVTRGQTGDILGQAGKVGLFFLQCGGSILGRFGSVSQLVIKSDRGLFKRGLFPFQPLDGFYGILVEPGFAFDIAGKLGDAGAQCLDRFHRAPFLIVQAVAFDQKALKDGGRDGFFLAERRNLVFGLDPRPRGSGNSRLRLRGLGRQATQFFLCRGQRVIGLAPAAIQQQTLGAAQFLTNLAIARGLTGLAGKRIQLPLKLFKNILDPQKVGFRGVELELGLVPAGVEAGNPSGLFQDATARLGFGVDKLGYLALTHQSRRMRAGRGVGKQHLHIACAHILAIGLVGRTGVAGDAADDFQRITVIEPRRRRAVGIVENQCHLGKVARWPAGGAGKDHVLHAAAAHGTRPVLAHDPAQRLEQVRLATTVGADNTRQTRRDQQIGRIDKAFEAGQPESGKLQMPVPALIPVYCAIFVRSGRKSTNNPLMWMYSGGYPQDIGLFSLARLARHRRYRCRAQKRRPRAYASGPSKQSVSLPCHG